MELRRYRTIVADPPWRYDDGFPFLLGSRGSKKIALPYAALSVADIRALPVNVLAEADARLFLWATNRYLPVSFGVLAAWGSDYRQTLVWHKTNAQPVRGSVAPNSAEFLIVGVRGTPAVLGGFPSAVIRAPRGVHSRKPDAILDHIEAVSPGPYLELFARRNRLGWDTWGDEALEHVSLGGES